ncbi:MAG: glucose 1-dehydrogenase [Solirubrobacteraceae bacterium]
MDYSLHPDPARLLNGRRALVTGGSSGIGEGCCYELAAHGAAVAVNFNGSPDAAHRICGEIERAGGRAVPIEMDVSDEASVQVGFAEATRQLGGLDILVNNAGMEKPFRLVDMPLDEWQKVLDVNLTGTFLCSREAARIMTADAEPAHPRCILMMSSVHEVIPWEQFSHYCASKGGMKLFAQSIARELAPEGIRVASIAPGAIATPINKDVLQDPAAKQKVLDEIPYGRWGEVADVARAVAWLASAQADYVVGTTLFVDGGMTLYPNFA